MSFDPHDNSKDLRYLIIAVAVVVVVFILGVTLNNSNERKLNAQLIQYAIGQKADLAAVRCLMGSQYVGPGCDTVSLVRELRVDPRFTPKELPTTPLTPDIQP